MNTIRGDNDLYHISEMKFNLFRLPDGDSSWTLCLCSPLSPIVYILVFYELSFGLNGLCAWLVAEAMIHEDYAYHHH